MIFYLNTDQISDIPLYSVVFEVIKYKEPKKSVYGTSHGGWKDKLQDSPLMTRLCVSFATKNIVNFCYLMYVR